MNSSAYLNPIAAVTQPREDLIRHLLTAYPLRDQHLRYGFQQLLEERGNIWQEPYIEGSQPYRSANSVADLVAEGLLHPEMASIFTPSDRSLYEHQERAVRAFIQDQQNIIVATGTGSGKTECFLLPMLDSLLKEGSQLIQPGVRVLILYPMNALVNDQVKRLRKLLCRQKDGIIRFGFYTSRTEREPKAALKALEEELSAYGDADLQDLFALGEVPQNRSELIKAAIAKLQKVQALSRQEIQSHPPHILVTNYSMLEHMLMRPLEREGIFQASASTFQLLVADEAHSYNGATGSEVAMLLERLKVAIGLPRSGHVRCIGTSASLGEQDKDPDILNFARDFFGENCHQVIRGDRLTTTERLGAPRLPNPDPQTFLQTLSNLGELPAINEWDKWISLLQLLISPDALKSAIEQATTDRDVHQLLWLVLSSHPFFHQAIEFLAAGPQAWRDMMQSTTFWGCQPPETEITEKALSTVLQLGTLARRSPHELPLIPVKIHLLFRSMEGLYACVNPRCSDASRDPQIGSELKYGRLYLHAKEACECCQSPVLELGSCTQCGQAYAFARLKNNQLMELPRAYDGWQESTSIYTLTSGPLDSITEEDDIEEEDGTSSVSQNYTLLLSTHGDGWIGHENTPLPIHSTSSGFSLNWHPKIVKDQPQGCYLQKCVSCGVRPSRSQVIRRFVTYTDEPLQVMTDSLFELLPEPKTSGQASQRKLLTFSDSRQDAAFFAADYQRNLTEKNYRQFLWLAFCQAKGQNDAVTITQVVEKLRNIFLCTSISHPDRTAEKNYRSFYSEDDNCLSNPGDRESDALKRAKEILLKEFALPFNHRSTLESYSILACHIHISDAQKQEISEILTSQGISISPLEAVIFITILTDIIRRMGVISIQGASDYFPETGGYSGGRPAVVDAEGRSKYYLFVDNTEESKKDKNCPSFLPPLRKDGSPPSKQSRLWYFYYRIFSRKYPDRVTLMKIFETLKTGRIIKLAHKGFQVDWDLLNLQETNEDWYQCSCCRQIVHIPGLSQVSSSLLNLYACYAFKCEGRFQPYAPEDLQRMRQEHYQLKCSPLPLRAQEHTAQLSTNELEKRENLFRQGKINLLSCSTTLEMGVDIGELQAVVLRNFPPHVSNYQQRAGRAGRRTDGVAVTLMYGQRRPHDRFYFEEPTELIAGDNHIPKVDRENYRIRDRHIRAELIAAFLRQEYREGAEKITIQKFLNLPIGISGVNERYQPSSDTIANQLKGWLKSEPAMQETQRWLPGEGSDFLDELDQQLNHFQSEQLDDWHALAKVLAEVDNLLENCDRQERKERKKLESRRDKIENELDHIANRRLHDALIQASILPIYGFPIDVVRLMTGLDHEYKSSQNRHRLERDRRMALSEYAPGQEIVVDDRVFESVGILNPKDLESQFYWVCENCNHFERSQSANNISECPTCGQTPSSPIRQRMKLFKIPKAFTTDYGTDAKTVPYIKPSRQGTSRVFLANDGQDIESLSSLQYDLRISSGQFFLANQGSGRGKEFDKTGFAICTACGRDISEQLPQSEASKTKKKIKKTHQHPKTGRDCPGFPESMHLGHLFNSDLLKIKFNQNTQPRTLWPKEVENFSAGSTIASVPSDEAGSGMDFWRSLTYALLAASAEVIAVPRNELDGLFRPSSDRSAEIIIYDNVPGGAGYSKQIATHFSEVLHRAYDITNDCKCAKSCYDCLRTYSNQFYHDELDRLTVRRFLEPFRK